MVAGWWQPFAKKRYRARKKARSPRLGFDRLESRALLNGGAVTPINFAPPLSVPEGAAPRAVLSADVDSDGKQDLITLDETSSVVRVRRGQGDGTFGAATTFATAAGPVAAALGDFNGDGRPDLAITAAAADSVSLLIGQGDGTFLSRTDFPVGTGPVAIVSLDIDRDGRLDLATANNFSGSVTLLQGQGDGTFAPPADLFVVTAPTDLVAGDFDMDGEVDLAVVDAMTEPDRVAVILNPQLRNPRSPSTTLYFPVGLAPKGLAAADVNGDGRLDLVVANHDDNDLSLLLGDPVTLFRAETRIPAGIGPVRVTAGDFNGDGQADIGVVLEGENRLFFLAGCGDGTFLPGLRPDVGLGPDGVAVGDFDGDGKPDVVTANRGSNDLSVLLNRSGVLAGFALVGPTAATAGSPIDVLVVAVDSSGQALPAWVGTVHFSSTDPQADLPADTTFTTSDGGQKVLSFTLKTAGPRAIRAEDSGAPTLYGMLPVAVTSGPVRGFAFLGLPGSATAGDVLSFDLVPIDAYGNATGYSGTVHFTSSDPQAVLPPDTTFGGQLSGPPRLDIIFKTAGPQSLTATDTTDGTLTTTAPGVSISAAAASSLAISGLSDTATAGVAQNFTLTALDAFGNVATGYTGTVSFASDDPQADVPASTTFTASDLGSRAFSVTFKTSGVASLTVTDDGLPPLTTTQSGISVIPGPAAAFRVDAPAGSLAGADVALTVTALDAFGNVVVTYGGTVRVMSSDANASLPADYTFGRGDGGVHTFTATLRTAGNQTITVQDTGTGPGPASASVAVTPAAASRLVLSPIADTVAGQAQGFTLTAFDDFANLATDYLGTVHFTSDDPQANLPADTSFTLGDAGSRTFSVTFKTSGAWSLTVADDGNPALGDSQGGIRVSPGPAASFRLDAPPRIEAGVPLTVVVTAFDALGNVATGHSGTVRLTSSDPAATLPPDTVFTPADAGTLSLDVTLFTAGAQTLTIVDIDNVAVIPAQANVDVVPGPASWLVLDVPVAAVAGGAFPVTITALDAFGNIAPDYVGTVRLVSGDGQAILPDDTPFSPADAGVLTLSVELRTSGLQAISVFDIDNPSLSATRGGIDVSPGPLASLELGAPATTFPGVAFDVTLTALDAFGNVVTDVTESFTVTATDPTAGLPPGLTFAPEDAGTLIFEATLNTVGSQLLTVTGGGRAPVSASANIVVQPPPTIDLGLSISLASDLIAEGESAELSGQFSPGRLPGPFTVTIDWGDDSEPTVLVLPAGASTFEASHEYDDNRDVEYPITVTVTDGGLAYGEAETSVETFDLPPDLFPTLDLAVEEGSLLLQLVTFVDPGDDRFTLTVDYGDGSPPQVIVLDTARSFTLSHPYAREGTYLVQMTVTDDEGARDSDAFLVEVFLRGLEEVETQTVAPGQTIVIDTNHTDALLQRAPGDGEAALLSIVYYDENPLPTGPDEGRRIVVQANDVRLTNARPADRLTVVFSYPPGVAGPVRLDFYDPVRRRFVPVQGSRLVPNSLRIDPVARTITVVFDGTSFPAVTELRGTVFTVSVTQAEGRSATVAPQLATAAPTAPGAFSTTTTFVSTATRTLSLTPSEDRTLSTARATLAAPAPSATGYGGNQAVGVAAAERANASSGGEEAEGRAARETADPWSLENDVFSRWQPSWADPATERLPAIPPTMPEPVFPLEQAETPEATAEPAPERPWGALALLLLSSGSAVPMATRRSRSSSHSWPPLLVRPQRCL